MPTLVTTTVTAGSLAVRPQPSLTAGDGVLLRPWSLDDAPAVMDAYQDEAIQRWHVMRADSLAETREWIAGWQGGWAAETDAIWAVVDAESDTLLGRAGLKHLKFSDGTADVAYWTVPAARGKGVCPRAVNAMAVLGFRGRLPPARPRTRGRQHGVVPGGREDRLRRRGRASQRLAPGRRPVRRARARAPALSTRPDRPPSPCAGSGAQVMAVRPTHGCHPSGSSRDATRAASAEAISAGTGTFDPSNPRNGRNDPSSASASSSDRSNGGCTR